MQITASLRPHSPGSFPYTQHANDYNLFVLDSVFPKAKRVTVDKAACQALGRFMKAEIERIIAADAPYVP